MKCNLIHVLSPMFGSPKYRGFRRGRAEGADKEGVAIMRPAGRFAKQSSMGTESSNFLKRWG